MFHHNISTIAGPEHTLASNSLKSTIETSELL